MELRILKKKKNYTAATATITINEIPQVQTVAYQLTSHVPASDKINRIKPIIILQAIDFLQCDTSALRTLWKK